MDKIKKTQELGEQIWQLRTKGVGDVNQDGIFTVSDFLLWAQWYILIPGDFLLISIMKYAPAIAVFLELDVTSISGIASWIISILFWLGLFVARYNILHFLGSPIALAILNWKDAAVIGVLLLLAILGLWAAQSHLVYYFITYLLACAISRNPMRVANQVEQ